MKKKWIVVGLCGVAAIVLGAVALEVADARLEKQPLKAE